MRDIGKGIAIFGIWAAVACVGAFDKSGSVFFVAIMAMFATGAVSEWK